MIIFNRTKSCSVDESEDGMLVARGTFIDTVHEICLTLHVSKDTLEIVKAKADMVRIPHPHCADAQAEDKKLVGIKIGQGARKAVQNAVGHAHGCTHMADLALDMVKALVTTNYRIQQRGKSEEEITAQYVEELGGTCNQWTKRSEEYKKNKRSVAK